MPAARMTIPISSPPRLLLANCSSSITHPSRYLQLQRVAEKCANARPECHPGVGCRGIERLRLPTPDSRSRNDASVPPAIIPALVVPILRVQDVVVLGM